MNIAQRNDCISAALCVLLVLEVNAMLHAACDVKGTAAVRISAVDARALAIIAKTARLFKTLPIHLKVVDRFASLAEAKKTLGDPQRAREVRPSPISGTLHEAAALRAEHTPIGLVGAAPRARIAGPRHASAESLGGSRVSGAP